MEISPADYGWPCGIVYSEILLANKIRWLNVFIELLF